MTEKVGIGIVGLGMAGKGHLRSFMKCGKARIVAGVDPDEKAREQASSEASGIECFSDYRSLLERKDIDIVTIATPHNLHMSIALDSLEAGKHVFCEKPFAMNSAECDRIIAAAKKAGKQILVFQNQRTGPAFRALKTIIDKENFGSPVVAVIQYLGCELERMRDTTSWKCSYDRAGGGVLLDGGVHVIDLSNWYYGTPVSVLAQLHKPKAWDKNKGESTGNLLVTYESGAVAQILASFETLLPGSFSEGTLKVTADLFYENGNVYAEYSYLGKFGMTTAARYVCGSDELHEISPQEMEKVNYHERVLDCLVNGTPPIVTAEEARMAVAVVEAAYESARTGNKADVLPLPA